MKAALLAEMRSCLIKEHNMITITARSTASDVQVTHPGERKIIERYRQMVANASRESMHALIPSRMLVSQECKDEMFEILWARLGEINNQ